MRIKIVIEYDGADFYGWQRQPNFRTVQGEIEKTLKFLTKKETPIEGSGRTDAGVHAFGQVASFEWNGPIPVDKLMYVLNHHTPDDIYIVKLEVVEDDFHARFSAIGKCYTYKLYRSERPSPLRRKHAYYVANTFDMVEVSKAIDHLIGEHDFKAFMASGGHVIDTTRIIYKIDVEYYEDEIHFHYYGNGFLYNMIRILTGLLVDIGVGKKKQSDVPGIIASKDRSLVKHTAAAEGLYLREVYYSKVDVNNALRIAETQ